MFNIGDKVGFICFKCKSHNVKLILVPFSDVVNPKIKDLMASKESLDTCAIKCNDCNAVLELEED